jgi:lysozyme
LQISFRSTATRYAAVTLALTVAGVGFATFQDEPDARATSAAHTTTTSPKTSGKTSSRSVGSARTLPKLGVDVSHYDEGFSWNRKDLGFGIVKATEGTSRIDSTFASNWKAIGTKGIVRGAYHYGHPGNDPVKEADYFLDTVGKAGLKDGDLLILDLETNDGLSTAKVNAWAKTWLQHVKDRTGVKAMFYSSSSFAEQYGSGLGDYPLWVAHYGRSPGKVSAPAPWKRWEIHQYTDSGHDWNVSRDSADKLRSLGYSSAKAHSLS